jgi:hypothetical protein
MDCWNMLFTLEEGLADICTEILTHPAFRLLDVYSFNTS